MLLNETFNVFFNGLSFRINMTEYIHGPLCIMANNPDLKQCSDSDSESGSL